MPEHSTQGGVVALAGRRIDAPRATPPRFPAGNAELVAGRIQTLFQQLKPRALVCSAANGSDLLAIEAAGSLGIERHIILPFPAAVFRATSVADRGGDWGERFDRLLAGLASNEEVVCLNYPPGREDAYAATNLDILTRAGNLASQKKTSVQAVIVWNGITRGSRDNTQEFAKAARGRGMSVVELLTL